MTTETTATFTVTLPWGRTASVTVRREHMRVDDQKEDGYAWIDADHLTIEIDGETEPVYLHPSAELGTYTTAEARQYDWSDWCDCDEAAALISYIINGTLSRDGCNSDAHRACKHVLASVGLASDDDLDKIAGEIADGLVAAAREFGLITA